MIIPEIRRKNDEFSVKIRKQLSFLIFGHLGVQ